MSIWQEELWERPLSRKRVLAAMLVGVLGSSGVARAARHYPGWKGRGVIYEALGIGIAGG